MADNPKKESTLQSDESPIGAIGIILLLLLVIGVPIAIAIWDVGSPVKGFAGFKTE